MRSLSYKTLIWHSTWFKHHCAPSHAGIDNKTSNFIGEMQQQSAELKKAVTKTKPGLFGWLKRSLYN